MFPRSIRQRRALVDSVAYLALLDEGDSNHAGARAIVSIITSNRLRLFTTNAVIIEAHALILSRLGRAVGLRFLREIDASNTTVVRIRMSDEVRAKNIIERYQDKDFSFTDALSFAVIERLQIRYAFTLDQHFAQYGLQVLGPETQV